MSVFKSRSLKNVLILMGGTSFSQLIPLIMSPILSRMYTPEHFGKFAVYSALVGIIVVFSTLKYELAIPLLREQSEAKTLLQLCIILTSIVSLITFIIISFFGEDILGILGMSLPLYWAIVITFSVFIGGLYQAFNYYILREQDYKKLSSNRIIQSSAIGVFTVFFAVIGLNKVGLVLGQLIGSFASCLALMKGNLDKSFIYISKAEIKKLAVQYINFPKITVWSSLINIFYNNGRYLILGMFFSASTLGQMFLMFRVLGAPSSIIGNALADVLFERVASLNNAQVAKSLIFSQIFKVWLILVVVAIIPMFVAYFFGELLFSYFFGENWAYAGLLASIFSIALFFEFTSSPFSRLFFIYKKDILYLFWEITRLSLIYGALFYMSFLGASETTLIYTLVVSTVVSYLILIFLVFRLIWSKNVKG